MAEEPTSAALFDWPATAVGAFPAQVLREWQASDKSNGAAQDILTPFARRGILVASDSSGLTRLSASRSLIEILTLIHQPKKWIHAYGRAIGGEAIGVWAADNTLMFYGEHIEARRVVAMLHAALSTINATCELRLGLCAHAARFFVIQNGVYGASAHRVETLAEDHAHAGELMITSDVHVTLDPIDFEFESRTGVPEHLGEVLRVLRGPTLQEREAIDFAYPAAFSAGFIRALDRGTPLEAASASIAGVLETPLTERAVVLVDRELAQDPCEEKEILDDLHRTDTLRHAVAAATREIVPSDFTFVKIERSIAIATFDDSQTAIAFATAVRKELLAHAIRSRIGIDRGLFLTFDLPGGGRDIAGQPVNVASKLAQDFGSFGSIYVSTNVTNAGALRGRSVSFDVKGVHIVATEISQ